MRCAVLTVLSLQLLGCASWHAAGDLEAPETAALAQTPWSQASGLNAGAQPWRHVALPGKRETSFGAAQVDGRIALVAQADGSASMVRKQLHMPPQALGHLRFSWKVPNLIDGADMARRDADDAPVRVVLAFDGDRSRFSAKNAMLSELALALTGEPLPYATLMYVWCNACAAGSVIHNPRTDRVRKVVVESGPAGLGRWQDYRRDVRGDFLQAFGEEPGALIGVALMTDADNTGAQAQAWYGPLQWDGPGASRP
jgi:hypothetical protein